MHVVHGKDELGRLIAEALALADELDLSLVSIQLEGARIALDVDRDVSGSPSWLVKRELSAPQQELTVAASNSNVVKLHASGSLQQLLREHEVLDARRQSLLQLTEGPPNSFEAERQLSEFASLIEAHRATERRCVYGPLLAKKADVKFGNKVKLKGLVGEIERDWERYLRNWDQAKIDRLWSEFCLITHSILPRAGERMRLEERVIYPLAFIGGLIELEDSAG